MAYSGTFSIQSIDGHSVTEAGVHFVGRDADLLKGTARFVGTYTGDVPRSMTGACGSGDPVQFTSFVASGGEWSGVLSDIVAGVSLSLIASNTASEQSDPVVMALFACGDFGLVAGQSNAVGRVEANFNGTDDPFPAAHIEGSMMFFYDFSDSSFKEEVPRRDYHMTRAFSILSRKNGIPICVVNLAIGGTKLETWMYPIGTSWVLAVEKLTECGFLDSGNSPFVLWCQGESDLHTNTDVWKRNLIQLVVDMRREWGIREMLAVPIFSASGQAKALATIEVASGGDANLFVACCSSDIRIDAPDHGDAVHVQRVQEAGILGERIGQALIWRAGYLSPTIGVDARPIGLVKYTRIS